jgi:Saccharopine dehydrogenase NADP binding domain
MKVLLLGGTGSFGKSTAALLACENLITEIGLASRNHFAAQQVSVEIGNKAHAVRIDITDLPRLSSIATGYDIIINAAGPTSEVQVPAIQAAINAGVHYCDIAAIGKYAERALKLDAKAKSRGVTAIIGTGWIATTGLMAMHAFHQLDKTEQISLCCLFDYSPGDHFSPEQSLYRAREAGKVETSWDLIETAGGPILTYREGSWVHLDPLENPVEVLHPSGSKIIAYPADSPTIYTLPSYLPGVQTVTCLLGMIPPQLMKLFIQKSQRIARGEVDWTEATIDYFETAVADKEHWLTAPTGYPKGWGMWAVAEGQKDRRKARYLCWPSMILDWTTVSLIIVALKILKGEISTHGVLPTEAIIELEPFLDDASKYVHKEYRGRPIFSERFEWLE